MMTTITMVSSSMAASTAAFSSLYCYYNKVSNLTLSHSPISRKSKFLQTLTLRHLIKTNVFPLPQLPPPYVASIETLYDNSVASEGDDEILLEYNEHVARLYVGNLPYSITSSRLLQLFEEAGRVVSTQIIYDRVTNRSRGFAFVTMGSIEEAKVAIRNFNGSQIEDRTVKVNFVEVPRGGEREVMGPTMRNDSREFIDSPHKIYAGNLGWGVTSQALRDSFANQPGLLSAKVLYERDSGRSRGYGFVSFESSEDAEAALNAMNGVEVEGRELRLNPATERSLTLSSEENAETNQLLSED